MTFFTLIRWYRVNSFERNFLLFLNKNRLSLISHLILLQNQIHSHVQHWNQTRQKRRRGQQDKEIEALFLLKM